jgi:hypothetical protein
VKNGGETPRQTAAIATAVTLLHPVKKAPQRLEKQQEILIGYTVFPSSFL